MTFCALEYIMYEVKRALPEVEDNIYHAVFNFFVYGLQPGSYTTLMLMQQFDRAKNHAHPLLLRAHYEMTPHQGLEYNFADLPEFLIGKNVETWLGYIHLPESERQRILDSYSDERVGEWHTYNAIASKQERSFREWINLAEATLKAHENV